jgi:hypothetical protein
MDASLTALRLLNRFRKHLWNIGLSDVSSNILTFAKF